MLALVQLKDEVITGWIIAVDKDDLLNQLQDIEPFDAEVKGIIKEVEAVKIWPYGRHPLQAPKTYLLVSLPR